MYVGQDIPKMKTGWQRFVDVLKFGGVKVAPRVMPKGLVVPEALITQDRGIPARLKRLEDDAKRGLKSLADRITVVRNDPDMKFQNLDQRLKVLEQQVGL